MIQIKNADQISYMKKAGRITGEALHLAGEAVKEGISTKALDDIVRNYIEKCGAIPSFLGYAGFPASACISVNNQVIHGIPSEKIILQEGDIVKIDVGACYCGYHGDSANTFAVGKISSEAEALIAATKESFYQGVKNAVLGNRIGDIGASIENHIKRQGFSVVRSYTGHGVGRELHEDPAVPNYGIPKRGARLYAGMTIAIEPMVNTGTSEVIQLSDGWTVITADGGLSAHYEHTVLITEGEAILLTEV